MVSSRISRKQLKEPDEFISFSSRVLKLALLHKKKLLLGVGVFLGVLVLISALNYLSIRTENRGSLLLTRLMHQYEKTVLDEGAQKAFERVQPNMQTIIKDYAGKACGRFARLALAHYAFQAGKFDSAAALYSQAEDDFKAMPLMKNIAAFGLGYALEAQKDYEKAIPLFEKLSSDSDMLRGDEALFALGRLYGLLNKKDLRAKALKQLAEKHPQSVYKGLAMNDLAG